MTKIREMVLLPVESVPGSIPTQQGGNMPEPEEPVEMDTPDPKPSKKKSSRPFEKWEKLIKIVLKLARLNSYDWEGRILNEEGSAVAGSNLINLLNYTMTAGRSLVGENEFINWLYKAHISPEMVINQNVRQKLEQLYRQGQPPPPLGASARRYATPKRQLPPARTYARDEPQPIKRKASALEETSAIDLPYESEERARKRVTREKDIKAAAPYYLDTDEDEDEDEELPHKIRQEDPTPYWDKGGNE